ncbi:MAG: S41 family peptidase, partial [Spirochaetaceae bacterium]|nr:S41 family peptidase [Spirochaetaceae bacterium]
MTERKMRSLVIDLRNNPGGLLEKVVEMADLILPEGLIISVENADGTVEEYWSDSKCVTVPLAVLVNSQSASASEIFAGAVQDHE